MADLDDELSKGVPRSLARLLRPGSEADATWRPDELADVLRHQLDAPLLFDLQRLGPEARQHLGRPQVAAGGIGSFGALLRHPSPPVELLRLTKEFAKSSDTRPESPLAFSRDALLWFSAGDDGTAQVWRVGGEPDREAFAAIAPGALPADAVCLAVSPDGTLALLGSSSGELVLCDAATAAVLRRLDRTTGGARSPERVIAVAFADGGGTALAADTQGTVWRWDLGSGASERLPGFGSGVVLAFSPDGALALLGDDRGVLHAVAVADGTRSRASIQAHVGEVLALAFAPDGRSVVSGGADRTVRIHDLAGEAPTYQSPPRPAIAACAFFASRPGCTRLLCCYGPGGEAPAGLWDLSRAASSASSIPPPPLDGSPAARSAAAAWYAHRGAAGVAAALFEADAADRPAAEELARVYLGAGLLGRAAEEFCC